MKRLCHSIGLILLALGVLPFLGGCQRVYYGTMEAFGKPKREILMDRVVEARDAQDAAKAQFSTALEQFSSVIHFRGGDLEAKYESLKAEYERCQSKAAAVHSRIRGVKDVAQALFREWQQELDEYTSPVLRSKSEIELRQTKTAMKS